MWPRFTFKIWVSWRKLWDDIFLFWGVLIKTLVFKTHIYEQSIQMGPESVEISYHGNDKATEEWQIVVMGQDKTMRVGVSFRSIAIPAWPF